MRCSKLGLWGLVAAAVIAALGGCGSGRVSTETGGPAGADFAADAGLDGPVMRHLAAYANEGEDAEVRGVVEIEGRCLYVALAEVGERYPIVWPASTSWDPEAGRVLLPNGDSVGHGDSVYGGGGYRSVDGVEAVAGGDAAALAAECVDNQYREIAVVNNQADGIRADNRDSGGAEPADEIDSSGIEGEWLVQSLTVDGRQIELDRSSPITVILAGKKIRGIAACSPYKGAIDWSAEAGFGRFVVSELGRTDTVCDAQTTRVEQAFLTALQAVDSYEAADGLYVAQDRAPTNFHLVRGGG